MSNNILIVDVDTEFTAILSQYLALEQFDVTVVCDGEQAVEKALSNAYDAIVLTVMLPKLNGFEVLRTIRAQLTTPVLVLTAKENDIDRMVGFEMGADDYLTKPCNPRELILRLHAMLRRRQPRVVIEHQGIIIDCGKRQVTHRGVVLELTNAEFNILEILFKAPGQAYSKEELTQRALNRKYTAYDRSIDVHISNLRNKLGDDQDDEPLIKTVRGFGYMLHV